MKVIIKETNEEVSKEEMIKVKKKRTKEGLSTTFLVKE